MGTKNLKLKSAKKDGWICPICNKVFRIRKELGLHKKEIHGSIQHVNLKYEQICPFCKKMWITTKTGYAKHTASCESNPNRIKGDAYRRYHSEETKKKISESRKKYLNEHPDKVPFKLNHSSKESYPEKYFREWLQKENIFSEREYQVGLYTLDFAWPERKIYLEIDGSQHHLDWMMKHDEERTKKLSELGWTCIQRIYWPDYQKLSKNEKEKYLNSLKEEILKII